MRTNNIRWGRDRFLQWGMITLAGVAMLGLTAACGDEETTVSEDNPVVEGAPPTVGSGETISESTEEVTVRVTGGTVDTDRLTLQVDEPVVIHVVNEDSQEYRLRIGDLVTETKILPAATTDVAFTTPNTAEIEGQLLPSTGDQPLDTFSVVVQGPSGNEP